MSNKKVKTFGKTVYVRRIVRKMMKRNLSTNKIRSFWKLRH